MAHRSVPTAFCTLVVLVAAMGFASAQERKVGQHIIYDVTVNGQGGRMGGGRSMTTTLDFAIDEVNSDGTAHANVSMQESHAPKVTFEGSVSPTGAVVGKSNPNIKPHVGMSEQEMTALTANTAAQTIGYTLAPLNAFADSCAARGALRVGDSWQGTINIPAPVNVVYTVTGRQNQAGHDSFAVKITSASGAPGTASGDGYYDPTMRLVSGLHFQLASPNGETETTDFTLHP
jgi:hypothetical protein